MDIFFWKVQNTLAASEDRKQIFVMHAFDKIIFFSSIFLQYMITWPWFDDYACRTVVYCVAE